MPNIFTYNKDSLQKQSMVSKIRYNRDYLLSKSTAADLNTYVSFDPFPTFNDGYEGEPEGKYIGTPGVRSIFNKMGAVIVGTSTGKVSTDDIITGKASEWRVSNNVPLMDNVATRTAIQEHSKCSVKELVEASSNGELGRETYSFSDFMYCKYLGKISNNYLITLRRFPLPVDDYISTMGEGDTRKDKEITSQNCQSIGCLVTWMGTPGNDMSNILKYSFKMPFKAKPAEWQNSGINADSSTGILNSVAAVFDPKYREQYQNSQASAAANKVLGTFFKVPGISGVSNRLGLGLGDAHYPASEWNSHYDNSKIYGPVDCIKDTYMRSDEGLGFEQQITVTFDYELRSYNGINGRQAMLDLISNILSVTYSTGTFWGGGFRGMGAHQNNIFTNLNIFKARGGAMNFIDAFTKDAMDLGDQMRNKLKTQYNGSVWGMIKSALNSLGGMLMSGVLNQLGRPQKQMVSSMLSPAPVGFWHLTIGNPHHPIMSIGNMILTGTEIEHYGPLGLDDFPTGLRVTCTLTRGKSRDIRDIEKLYMHGNDRIYTSMGPKVFDMYQHAKEYKGEGKKFEKLVGDENASITVGEGESATTVEVNDISKMKHVLQKYFGHIDTYSIYVSACEQECGAHKKKKTGTGAGDSRAQSENKITG
jgi:hypothetical protein